jgi:hypothetical protein
VWLTVFDVFAVFALMPILDMKEMGIGLTAAVLIDATIVRAVLLTTAPQRGAFRRFGKEPEEGLEPTASALQKRRSTN